MNEYSNVLKVKLLSLIREMSDACTLYVKNPESDFIRTRKLPFETVMQLLISMGGNSIYKELLESSGYNINTATTSAFVQQRGKILPCAFEFLLHEFTTIHNSAKTYEGYRIIAADGSDVNITTNPKDTDTHFQTAPGSKGYNLLHLNALYDLCNRLYLDAIASPLKICDERLALETMVDRSRINGKVIVVADRGYESYNVFAHIERKGWNYVIRVKDIDSNGILSGLSLPSCSEFDVCVRITLTKKQTNVVKAQPEIYKRISNTQTFDFLDLHDNKFYPMSFRVVRFALPSGLYETVITNLDANDFPPCKLKYIYKMRWGIETSFRNLKYTIGLVNFHSKKREFIIQEIFARLIMYNFTEMTVYHIVIAKSNTKHLYKANFTVAVHVCRRLLRSKDDEPPPDVEALISKNILPVRVLENSNATRKPRIKSVVSFIYRVS